MSLLSIFLTFIINVAFLISLYALYRFKGFVKNEDADLTLRISFWGILILFLYIIIWQLSYFNIISFFGASWDPARDNQYSTEPPAPPPPSSVKPVTDKEATEQVINKHKDLLKEFEAE